MQHICRTNGVHEKRMDSEMGPVLATGGVGNRLAF